MVRSTGTNNGQSLNSRRIFRELYFASPLTKKELAQRTGLSKPTVSKALSDLGSGGLVAGKGRKDIPTGRKPIKYGLHGSHIYGIGVDLEIPELNLAAYDLSRRMVASKGRYLNMDELKNDPTGYLARTLERELIDLANQDELRGGTILGAGIASSGVVRGGKFRPFTKLDQSAEIELKEPLEEKLGFPTSFGNDVDFQLVSELDRLGPIEDANHIAIYFSARLSGNRRPMVRIGGSFAIDGKVGLGTGGGSGEFGHMSISTKNLSELPETKCGNETCLESFVNHHLNREAENNLPSAITEAIEQSLKDLIFAFGPSLVIVDLEAFPEVSEEIINELARFKKRTKGAIGFGDINIREPLDKNRSVTRGAAINHFNKLLLDPDNFSLVMKEGQNGNIRG